MKDYLFPLLFLQRFFVPSLVLLVAWATWRTIVRRDLAVGLVLYLGLLIVVDGFFNTGIFLPGLEKGSVRYSEVCAVFLWFGRPSPVARQSHYKVICFLVGLYFVLILASAFRSDSVVAALFEFRTRIFSQIVAFSIAMRGLATPNDYRRFFFCLTFLIIITGLFVFWDVFFDRWLLASEMLSKPEYYLNRKHGRFGSFFLNPNYLGAFTVLVFPGAFAWTLNEKRLRIKLFGAAGLLALMFCLVETQSRGPLLSFAIVLVLLLLGPAGGMSRTRRLSVAIPFFSLFALLMPGFFEHAIGRFDTLEQEASTESRTRMSVWIYTERAIAESPFLGIGFGEQQFLKTMNGYGFEREYGEESLDNPHNSYLQMTVYAGFPALLAFVFANVWLLSRAALAIWRDIRQRGTYITFGVAVGIAGFLAVIYPDMHMFTQTVAPVYWVFFGLLLSLATTSGEQSTGRTI